MRLPVVPFTRLCSIYVYMARCTGQQLHMPSVPLVQQSSASQLPAAHLTSPAVGDPGQHLQRSCWLPCGRLLAAAAAAVQSVQQLWSAARWRAVQAAAGCVLGSAGQAALCELAAGPTDSSKQVTQVVATTAAAHSANTTQCLAGSARTKINSTWPCDWNCMQLVHLHDQKHLHQRRCAAS